MVPAEQEEVLGKFDLVAKQQQDRLERLFPTVDVVAQEEVVGLRWEAAHLEQANEVGVLLSTVLRNGARVVVRSRVIKRVEQLTCPCTSPTILTGGLSSIRVGCDRNTSRAAAHTLAISAFLSGGDLVTLPEYPASSNRPIMLSTSNTCGPPAPVGPRLPRLIVALSALPGDRPLDGPGDVPGEDGIAEGGGDVPRSDDRRPEAGDAKMLFVVGIAGEPGTARLPAPAPDRTDPASMELELEMAGLRVLPVAEEKLDTLPFRSFARDFRADALGVLRLLPETSMGEVVGDELAPSGRISEGGDEMVVLESESARSEADSSLDRVRLIFLDGELPMLGAKCLDTAGEV